MDALDVLRLIIVGHNAWMDEDLAAQALPRLPPVIPETLPPLHGDEAQRLMTVLRQMRQERRRVEGPTPPAASSGTACCAGAG